MPENKKITIRGTVQGVGFRPFVWRTAVENRITGFVGNSPEGVFIEARGEKKNLKKFINDLKNKKPDAAVINYFEVKPSACRKFSSFKIVKSHSRGLSSASVPADLAICPDCAGEIEKNSDRRYEYPFTNCTNCGPRFSIVEKLPYDRPFTSMKKFKMCLDCMAEYGNPADRRFHAQPNACPVCGPHVFLVEKGVRTAEKDEALERVSRLLSDGALVAIKGLGGFHLACDASNESAVKKLRKFKDRPYKPFAVMTESLEFIKKYLFISEKEKNLIFSQKAPIVALKKKNISYFNGPAPGLSSLGVMSAYTPLHRIVFRKMRQIGFKGVLIMTSGNLRDEPIVKDNETALKIFSSLDALLLHNRPIHNRIDDSLIQVSDSGEEKILRRARGYVPSSFILPFRPSKNIFASGADIKNSFAFTRGRELFLSQYIGDLDESANADFFRETYSKMKKLLLVNPSEAVADMHPSYRSLLLAKETGLKVSQVQHHIAHFFSVMAEHGLRENAIGVSLDGTGYGLDGKIWGGEFFVYKGGKVLRRGKLADFPLPGGEICVKEAFRSLMGLAHSCNIDIERFCDVEKEKKKLVTKMLSSCFNSPETSSMGRLFDAFSVLILGRPYATYEAQLPMELEAICSGSGNSGYSFAIEGKKEILEISSREALKEAIKDRDSGRSISFMSRKFHYGIAKACVDMCLRLSAETGIKTFCFSGGCFQNLIFSELVKKMLSGRGFKIYFNNSIPSNDGGISAGQIYFRLLKAQIP